MVYGREELKSLLVKTMASLGSRSRNGHGGAGDRKQNEKRIESLRVSDHEKEEGEEEKSSLGGGQREGKFLASLGEDGGNARETRVDS